MQRVRRGDIRAGALAFTLVTGALIAVGAVSLSDAADGWQQVLNTYEQLSNNPCLGPHDVYGWGDRAILAFAAAALVFVGMTGWALLEVRRWGKVTAFLTIVMVCVLWLDAYAVSQSPSTDCDAAGLGGAAGVSIVRAGWCFFVASMLCGISWAWLASRWKDRDEGVELVHA